MSQKEKLSLVNIKILTIYFFRDCFPLFIFWKTTLSHGKLNKGS